MDIKRRIMQSLRPRRDGLLLRSDVNSFGSASQVSAAINTLVKDGLVIRLDRGVYAKPDKVEQVGRRALLDKAMLRIENQRTQNRKQDQRARHAHQFPGNPTALYVRQLAKREGITFVPTYADLWAKAVTNLAGDEVKSDSVDDLLVALTRAGKLSARDMARLVIAHHRDLARV